MTVYICEDCELRFGEDEQTNSQHRDGQCPGCQGENIKEEVTMEELAEELTEELGKRGSAEIVNMKVCQATQAIDEKEDSVKFLLFGELKEQKTIPIEEACGKCDFWKGRFKDTKVCQEKQGKDAKARGFSKLICPSQFKKEGSDNVEE